MRQGWIAVALIGSFALSLSPLPITLAMADDPTSEVVSRINLIRVQNGLSPLVIQSQLVASAQEHAVAMASGGFFGHVAPNGSTMVTRDEAAGYSGWTVLEENIAGGQSSVAEVVNAWMESPAHRNDLLSPRVHDTGVGFVHLPGSRFGYYWVEEFGTRIGPPTTPSKDPIASPIAQETPAT